VSKVKRGFYKNAIIARKCMLSDLKNQLAFLKSIEKEFKSTIGPGNIKDELSQKIVILEGEVATLAMESDMKPPKRHSSAIPKKRLPRLQNEIKFLCGILLGISNCPDCEIPKRAISERIISLRNEQFEELFVLCSPDSQRGVQNEVLKQNWGASSFPYIPQKTKISHWTQWPEMGHMINYSIYEKFPPEGFLDELTQHYSQLDWKPLHYDLCYPFDPGSLFEGWKDGQANLNFWTQTWINDSDEVIIIIVRNKNSSRINVATIYLNAQYTGDKLGYYRSVHGNFDNLSAEEAYERIKEQGLRIFSFWPIDSKS
jgi:hypothetical protein